MSEIKVNKISPKQLCTQLTLGDSGDTIIIPAGATIQNSGTATGFGATGAVNWDTTAKTTGFTAVSGVGYFCNTTSSAFTVTLPATPSAGDIVAIADYANTAATNNITVGRNSSLIDGNAIDAKININGQVYTLVYIDATEGWKTVGQTFNQIQTAEFIAATGGTITTCGNYKIHTFTGPGTFTVTNAGNSGGSNSVDYMVVAGGGSGGGRPGNNYYGGGGGAGGFRESVPSPAAWTASPLANPGGALPVSVQGYPITVGAGGAGVSASNNGSNSIFSTITSAGGGKGGIDSSGFGGSPGGSGGGTPRYPSGSYTGGSGNTPPTSPPQGNNGATPTSPAPAVAASGGGGATAASLGNHPNAEGGTGGNGATTSISGSPTTYAGGGGGASWTSPTKAAGGSGGGGNGSGNSGNPTPSAFYAGSGTTNTGGGGGGGGADYNCGGSGAGGSGIVVIRYKFQ